MNNVTEALTSSAEQTTQAVIDLAQSEKSVKEELSKLRKEGDAEVTQAVRLAVYLAIANGDFRFWVDELRKHSEKDGSIERIDGINRTILEVRLKMAADYMTGINLRVTDFCLQHPNLKQTLDRAVNIFEDNLLPIESLENLLTELIAN